LHTFYLLVKFNRQSIEPLAKVFFCGSTSSPRTDKVNDSNLKPFTLSLSKGKVQIFARASISKEVFFG